MRIAAIGDSISWQPGGWVYLVAERLGASVDNFAVPGLEAHRVVETQLPRDRYGLVTVYVGTNDVRRAFDPARFEASLHRLAAVAVEHGDRVVIPTVPVALSRNAARANSIVRSVVGEVGAVSVPLDDCRGYRYFAGDRVHPNANGHRTIARRVLMALDRGDDLPGVAVSRARYALGSVAVLARPVP